MSASFLTLGNEIQTTDGIPQPSGAVDVPTNSTVVIDLTVVARALDGTSRTFFHKSMATKSGQLQVVSLINNLQSVIGDIATTLWSFSVGINPQNQIEFTIAGAAGVTIDWRTDGTVYFFQPEGP